jgi:hypothetical protein
LNVDDSTKNIAWIKRPYITGFSTCFEIIIVIGTPVALLIISGLETMEQIVKGAGIEKSGPTDLEHLLGKVAVKTVPRRRPMKCGWHPPISLLHYPNLVMGN